MKAKAKPRTGAKSLDPKQIRTDFPIFERKVRGKPLVYLDNSATAQKPRQVIDAIRNYYERTNANVHRGVHTLSYEASVLYEEAHKQVARFIGANSWREIVFTRNATEAINLVAYAWGMNRLREGDEVLITMMEHHSNIVPWLMLRDRLGITLKFLDIDEQGRLRLDQLPELLNERTKLVGVAHASNVLGTINPVKQITAEAHRVGAKVLIDAAQSVPHLPVDVREIGCDFLAASGHKMLGPAGTGFLYAPEQLLEAMDPFLYGGNMIITVTTEGATWNELPWKFEAGTPNIAGGIGLGPAIDYLEALGMERIVAHEKRLTDYALEQLSSIPGLRVYGPTTSNDRLGVISFNLEGVSAEALSSTLDGEGIVVQPVRRGVHPHDLADILDSEGIAVRSGHHCAQPLMNRLGMGNSARASFYLYNTEAEVDRLVEAIDKAKRIFKV